MMLLNEKQEKDWRFYGRVIDNEVNAVGTWTSEELLIDSSFLISFG